MKKFFRRSDYAQSGFKILDAGCGTGGATTVLYAVAEEKGCKDMIFYAFDLTPAMLLIFQEWIKKAGAKNIFLKQADVLRPEQLPADWNGYDRIISCGMLEYLPKGKMPQAIDNLKKLLKPGGKLAVFITKKNILTKLFIERWWKANIYGEEELQKIFTGAGFGEFKIITNWWRGMFIVEAKKYRNKLL